MNLAPSVTRDARESSPQPCIHGTQTDLDAPFLTCWGWRELREWHARLPVVDVGPTHLDRGNSRSGRAVSFEQTDAGGLSA
jgi:hypothetical protein